VTVAAIDRPQDLPQAKGRLSETTRMAQQDTVLSPRFYTTDFAALDRIDISHIRAEWDAIIDELASDPNRDHFRRSEPFTVQLEDLDPALRQEFLDFLVSSITSEFSGCVLYAEIAKRIQNPDLKALFRYMSRDESRHAGFINESLKDFGVGVDLGFLTKTKKYTFFKPKFIFYATYLSEKIGYARYITIFRQLERHPELRFHPIFNWFEEWCNDEFRHGEAFALLLHAHPELMRGGNRFWVKFFLLSVYATMYVRDHSRPAFHKALGLDPTEYDYRVFEVCSEITKQIFPFTLDIDNPRFRKAMEDVRKGAVAMDAAESRGGWFKGFRKAGALAGIVGAMARLFFVRTVEHAQPASVRLAPSW
jgi:magnesium-protoporphyrin IX monomethyl ester (oxidative) cyclase